MLLASSRSPSLEDMCRRYSDDGATSIRDNVRRAMVMLPAPKSSSPDRKALVGAPDLVMPRARVARLLHRHVNERAAARAPGSVDNLPKAVIVGELITGLEQNRQERSHHR